jgi:hypothetical protein
MQKKQIYVFEIKPSTKTHMHAYKNIKYIKNIFIYRIPKARTSIANRTPPSGDPKATLTPHAHAADNSSRFRASLWRYFANNAHLGPAPKGGGGAGPDRERHAEGGRGNVSHLTNKTPLAKISTRKNSARRKHSI